MKEVIGFIPLLIIAAFCYLGYRFLRLKGYTSRWYFLVLFAFLPVFWIVFGLAKTRSRSKEAKAWSTVSIVGGFLYLASTIYGGWNNTSNLLPVLNMIYVTVCGVAGYQFMKLKGYTSWNYLALIISSTPLFWFVFGLLRANNTPTKKTRLWSYVALAWGVISLAIALYLQPFATK